MPSGRRSGAPDAKNRGVLRDAAEQLMLEEGYAAVTSRRLADRAGLKPQLVHYYFRTMDDLFLAVFRRRAEQGLKSQARALESPQPLWALWRLRPGLPPSPVPGGGGGGSVPISPRAGSRWSSPRWRTTASRCAPRSRTMPNVSATSSGEHWQLLWPATTPPRRPCLRSCGRCCSPACRLCWRWKRGSVCRSATRKRPKWWSATCVVSRAIPYRWRTGRGTDSPAADGAEHSFGAVLRHDDRAVYRDLTVEVRRSGFWPGVRNDHRPFLGLVQIQFVCPRRMIRAEVGFDVRHVLIRVMAPVGEDLRLLVEVVDLRVDRVLGRERVLDVMQR